MSVEFDEDNFSRKTYSNYVAKTSTNPDDPKGMAKWLIDNGLANSLTSANIILIAAMLLVFIIAIYIFRSGLTVPFVPKPEPIGPVPLQELIDNR